ncbi:MAG: hypothetical protein LC802_03105 [Acidobacteria bacterium]|nr:hypothetical protein [Acidobacteriota bacterium]
MRLLITLLLLLHALAAGTPALSTRQTDERRFLDSRLVPAEGRAPADFVPRGWKIEEEVKGDLNGDGVADAALRLVEDLPVETGGVWNERYRALVVLFGKAGGGFARAAVTAKLLACSTCAGMLGDPEGGNISLEIKNGVLNVSQLSGARDATDLTQRFRHDPRLKRFRLIGEDIETYDRALGNSEIVSTNYLTGVRVTKKHRVLKKDGERVLVSTARKKVAARRRFIEDVDYER